MARHLPKEYPGQVANQYGFKVVPVNNSTQLVEQLMNKYRENQSFAKDLLLRDATSFEL